MEYGFLRKTCFCSKTVLLNCGSVSGSFQTKDWLSIQPSRSGPEVKCAPAWYVHAMAPPMLVDASDDFKYVGQKGSVAMLCTCFSVYISIGWKGRGHTRRDLQDPLSIWNLWVRTHKVQNRSNQWLNKMSIGPTKNKKTTTFYSHTLIQTMIHVFCDFTCKGLLCTSKRVTS